LDAFGIRLFARRYKLEKFYRRVCDIEVILAMILLGTSVSIIFIAAVMRTAGYPIRWGNDLALMLFAWSTFISADIVFRIKRHVVVDILTSKLPGILQNICEILVHAIILFSIGFLFYYGMRSVIASRARVFQAIPWLSYSFVSASLPCSMVMMMINELRHLYYRYVLHTELKDEM
jgi:TRAP-type C4-dicarboxylate transport system permease small subunit